MCAYPTDGYGRLVYIEDEGEDLSYLSPRAHTLLALVRSHNIAWLRLMPDTHIFQEYPLLHSSASPELHDLFPASHSSLPEGL